MTQVIVEEPVGKLIDRLIILYRRMEEDDRLHRELGQTVVEIANLEKVLCVTLASTPPEIGVKILFKTLALAGINAGIWELTNRARLDDLEDRRKGTHETPISAITLIQMNDERRTLIDTITRTWQTPR